MKTITLYHGTKSTNTNYIMDNLPMTPAANGNGFYMTTDIEVARMYGHSVIAIELDADDMPDLVVRPFEHGTEYVCTTVASQNYLILDHIDMYLV